MIRDLDSQKPGSTGSTASPSTGEAILFRAPVERASFSPPAPARDVLALRRRLARDMFEATERAIESYRCGGDHRLAEDRTFNPWALVEEVIALVRAQGRDARSAIRFECGLGEPPRVVGDPSRLRGALAQLMGGVAQAAPAGAVLVQAEAFEHDCQAVLDVSITCDGPRDARMAGAEQGRERWVDCDLSFVLSAALSRALDGENGSSGGFTITARLRLPTARVDAAFRHPPIDAMVADDALKGLRILVVEDVALNRELIELLLAPYGCDTDGAADGWAALDAIDHQDYDMILMDMNMPRMDGFEAIRRIRARADQRGRTPILAVTGRALAADIAKIRALGASGFLAKPFISVDMVAAIVECLKR